MKTSIEIKTVLNGTLLDFDAITPNNDKFDYFIAVTLFKVNEPSSFAPETSASHELVVGILNNLSVNSSRASLVINTKGTILDPKEEYAAVITKGEKMSKVTLVSFRDVSAYINRAPNTPVIGDIYFTPNPNPYTKNELRAVDFDRYFKPLLGSAVNVLYYDLTNTPGVIVGQIFGLTHHNNHTLKASVALKDLEFFCKIYYLDDESIVDCRIEIGTAWNKPYLSDISTMVIRKTSPLSIKVTGTTDFLYWVDETGGCESLHIGDDTGFNPFVKITRKFSKSVDLLLEGEVIGVVKSVSIEETRKGRTVEIYYTPNTEEAVKELTSKGISRIFFKSPNNENVRNTHLFPNSRIYYKGPSYENTRNTHLFPKGLISIELELYGDDVADVDVSDSYEVRSLKKFIDRLNEGVDGLEEKSFYSVHDYLMDIVRLAIESTNQPLVRYELPSLTVLEDGEELAGQYCLRDGIVYRATIEDKGLGIFETKLEPHAIVPVFPMGEESGKVEATPARLLEFVERNPKFFLEVVETFVKRFKQ